MKTVMAKWKSVAAAIAPLALAACATTSPLAPARDEAGIAPKPPVWLISDISGKSAAALDESLGEPDLVRVEGAGEFRRYRLAACSLIVILYPDETGVKHAQGLDASALESGDDKPDLEECLAAGKPAAQ